MEPALKQEYAAEELNANLKLARELVSALEQADQQKSETILTQLLRNQEHSLFNEVGQLTRHLHDSLGNFCTDTNTQVTDLVENDEISSARNRLNYVIEKTSDSAHRTLEAVEQMQPLAEQLRDSSEQMKENWERFKRREMNAEDFRVMAKDISTFLEKTSANTASICSSLSDVLLAQDYQDLTGQMIRQVIEVVNHVEDSLVQIVRCRGKGVCETQKVNDASGPDIKAEGPQLNQEANDNVVSGQDEVDDLLSSLGF